MIAELNAMMERIEARVSEPLDLAELARRTGTTEYHLRRLFSSLAGMPLAEYVRRRRMTIAAGEVIAGGSLLEIATAHGYGSTEAFGRAFLAVHGVTPRQVRASGGPLSTQQRLRFSLVIEGSEPMDTRIVEQPAFALAGRAARVPLIHRGVNSRIAEHVAGIPPEEHLRLKGLSSTEPAGLLQVTDDVDQDAAEGTELTYLHGVAVRSAEEAPDDLDVIEVPAGRWAVFTASGACPSALQSLWAATASEWFPSNPWRLRPGPSIVAVLERAEDFSTATIDLWLPVERA